MNEDVIQSKIRLVSFKAVKCNFHCDIVGAPDLKEPVFELNLGNLKFSDRETWFAKVFLIKVQTPYASEVVNIDVEYHTVFECSTKIDDEFLKSEFSSISAPAIGFPYVRAFISGLCLQAGIPPIILPSINFVQYAKTNTSIDLNKDEKGGMASEP